MSFTPVSRMCLYCKERIFITEPVDEVTCPKCAEVMKVVMGRKLRLSRITVNSADNK